MKAFLALSSLLLLAGSAYAEPSWRVRAREHFETGKLNLSDGQGPLAFRGFLSCFDVFREDPMKLAYGLAVQRGTIGRVRGHEEVRATALGAEVKHFPLEKRPWFWRGGLLATNIDPTDAGGDFWTYGFGLGAGVELPVWKLGVAPEVGGRFSWASRGRRLANLYVALGVHFYVFKGDGAKMEANQ